MSSDQAQNTIPNSTAAARQDYLEIIRNPDSRATRSLQFPSTTATSDYSDNISTPILTKDVPINPTYNTFVRMFLPSHALEYNPSKKLPLIVYYHGGGFIYLSAASSINHDFCTKMAATLDAVVVSVDYRLAPMHRLPAAYDDAVEALHWIRSSDDLWLHQYADVSKCFLMGTSSGANIVYHVGQRASAAIDEFSPLKITGLIFHHSFFGGVQRTASELRLVNDPILPLSGNDRMWDLALPIGVDRDHKYSNPMVNDDHSSDNCDQIRKLGWKLLVIGCDGDPLIDRQVEFVEMLKKKGIQVTAQFKQGDYHGVELLDLSKAESLFVLLKDFLEPN